jgi:hypothetical protein
VPEPRVPLGLSNGERLVAQSQSRVPSLLAVRGGTAPILDEKESQAFGGSGQVLIGVDGPEDRVGRNACVETVDEQPERRLSARELKNGLVQTQGVCDPTARCGANRVMPTSPRCSP